jgi:hypothetical protein
VGLTYSAIKLATGHTTTQSQNERAHETTAEILSWPAGRWLVGLAGACIVGVGLARLVVFSLIGFFAIRAAIDYDPKEAVGLDGALQKLTHQSYGPWLLGVTAAGLLAYALFCFADARYRRV